LDTGDVPGVRLPVEDHHRYGGDMCVTYVPYV
jgi:hypothetical protein